MIGYLRDVLCIVITYFSMIKYFKDSINFNNIIIVGGNAKMTT